jgi:hypothetical protein
MHNQRNSNIQRWIFGGEFGAHEGGVDEEEEEVDRCE